MVDFSPTFFKSPMSTPTPTSGSSSSASGSSDDEKPSLPWRKAAKPTGEPEHASNKVPPIKKLEVADIDWSKHETIMSDGSRIKFGEKRSRHEKNTSLSGPTGPGPATL